MMIFKKSILKYFALSVFIFLNLTQAFSQDKAFKEYQQEITGSNHTIDMVPISEGTFSMGSPQDSEWAKIDEQPAHQVKMDAFYMSKYEITWEIYMQFINRNIDDNTSQSKDGEVVKKVDAVAGATIPYVDMSLGMGTGDGLPVGNVTQLAASRFCEWLSAKTGHFYRLPTEAEWEYAARAGTTTAFSFGDDNGLLNQYAWFYENSDGSYHKVGQKKPNPWGLYDMYGNVAEWTLDQYLPAIYKTENGLSENPLQTVLKEFPVSVRGGSFKNDAVDLRSAARTASTKNWKMRDPQFPKSKWWNTDSPFVGFRIVRPKNPPEKEKFEQYWQTEKL